MTVTELNVAESDECMWTTVKGRLAGTRRIPLMQNFFVKSLADKNSMKTRLREVTQKLWSM